MDYELRLLHLGNIKIIIIFFISLIYLQIHEYSGAVKRREIPAYIVSGWRDEIALPLESNCNPERDAEHETTDEPLVHYSGGWIRQMKSIYD